MRPKTPRAATALGERWDDHMPLDGKKGLIVGIADECGIAYGCAESSGTFAISRPSS
jgi:hypothetical protein